MKSHQITRYPSMMETVNGKREAVRVRKREGVKVLCNPQKGTKVVVERRGDIQWYEERQRIG
jgi:hypothetical protein